MSEEIKRKFCINLKNFFFVEIMMENAIKIQIWQNKFCMSHEKVWNFLYEREKNITALLEVILLTLYILFSLFCLLPSSRVQRYRMK